MTKMLKKCTYLFILLAALLIFSGGGYYLYTGGLANLRFRSLLSNLPSEDSISFSSQSYLSYVEGVCEITAVSTGEILHRQLENNYTESPLAEATTLKLVTRDTNGSARTIEVILQISPATDSQRNVSYWLPANAAETRGLDLSVSENEMISDELLKSIFEKGSVWVVTPLVNYEVHGGRFSQDNQEYVFLARRYYGDSLSKVAEFINSGLVSVAFDHPILLMGLEMGE